MGCSRTRGCIGIGEFTIAEKLQSEFGFGFGEPVALLLRGVDVSRCDVLSAAYMIRRSDARRVSLETLE
jgi:hypothetical protein